MLYKSVILSFLSIYSLFIFHLYLFIPFASNRMHLRVPLCFLYFHAFAPPSRLEFPIRLSVKFLTRNNFHLCHFHLLPSLSVSIQAIKIFIPKIPNTLFPFYPFLSISLHLVHQVQKVQFVKASNLNLEICLFITICHNPFGFLMQALRQSLLSPRLYSCYLLGRFLSFSWGLVPLLVIFI